VYFRDLAHIIAVFLQLLFYATPVLYQDTLIKNPTAHRILMSNPMRPVRAAVRDLTYGLTTGRLDSWLYILGRPPSWSRSALGVPAIRPRPGEQL